MYSRSPWEISKLACRDKTCWSTKMTLLVVAPESSFKKLVLVVCNKIKFWFYSREICIYKVEHLNPNFLLWVVSKHVYEQQQIFQSNFLYALEVSFLTIIFIQYNHYPLRLSFNLAIKRLIVTFKIFVP